MKQSDNATNAATQVAQRQHLRQLRQAIQGRQRQQLSEQASRQALALFARLTLRRVATFLSLSEEIDTAPLNQALLASGVDCYLPYVTRRHTPLHWLPYHSDTNLEADAVGVLSPVFNETLTLGALALDAVIVPLVGADSKGNRIGMGGGYYDRSFANKPSQSAPLLLGFAYDCQIVPHIERQHWDITLDGIITPSTHLFYATEDYL